MTDLSYPFNHLIMIKFLIILLFFVGRWVQGNWKKDGKLTYGVQDLQYVIILGLMLYAQAVGLFDLEKWYAWRNISIFISVLPLKWAASNVGYGMGYNGYWGYLGEVNFFDGLLDKTIGDGRPRGRNLMFIYFLMLGFGLYNL